MGDNTHPFATGEEIDDLILAGYSERDIADKYQVSISAVSRRRWFNNGGRRIGVPQTTSEIARDMFPWKGVGKPFNDSAVWKLLKSHSIWQARRREEDLTPVRLRKLVSFYRKIVQEGLIVEFDPTIPPGEGVHRGFAFRTRVETDGYLLIRANALTDLSDLPMRTHWSIPYVMPEGAEDMVPDKQQEN